MNISLAQSKKEYKSKKIIIKSCLSVLLALSIMLADMPWIYGWHKTVFGHTTENKHINQYLCSTEKKIKTQLNCDDETVQTKNKKLNSPRNLRIETQYTKFPTVYQKDWLNLPTGKYYKRKQNNDYLYTNGAGKVLKKTFQNKESVKLDNIAYKVYWDDSYDKYKNTLIHILNCGEVIIENISIIQLDHDYKGSHSILVEDCDDVIIRNSCFSGTLDKYHIRVEGCKRVLIDNIEISGHNYGKNGVRCGGGILVNNGKTNVGEFLLKRGMFSPAPEDLTWCVVQNCYIHDNLAEGTKWRNQDAVLIQSPSDGIMFNCYVENWKKGDGAYDISHRRTDELYQKNLFRIERNIIKNCRVAKTPGTSSKGNILFFANNIYINTFIADYHAGHDIYHVHETYIFDKNRPESTFYKLWGIKDGRTIFRNNLLHVFDTAFNKVYFQSNNSQAGDYRLLDIDYFVYLIPTPDYWLKGKGDYIREWSQWKENGLRDKHSRFQPPGASFVDSSNDDYRLTGESPAVGLSSTIFLNATNKNMSVETDFYGKSRKPLPSAGALEVY